jgi:transcription elongation factor Elf1
MIMKTKEYKKCKKCGSKNLLITSDLNGNLIAATCIDCGWAFESELFKKMMKMFDESNL